MILKIKKLHECAVIPQYATEGAAGFDLHSPVSAMIPKGKTVTIPLGIAMEVPAGFEVQVRSRSGLARKHGVFILNGIGTIDSDYRGELAAILHNSGTEDYRVDVGDRVCQGVLKVFEKATIEAVEELSDTARGANGFGSTGRA